LLRPVTIAVVALVVAEAPPGVAVTVYVTAAPPSGAAVQDRIAEPSPGVPARLVAAPGVVRGVTAGDAADAEPVPAAFDAATVNV
jgi:hypothetical protein